MKAAAISGGGESEESNRKKSEQRHLRAPLPGRMQSPQDPINGTRRKNAAQLLWDRLKEHPLARLGPGLITGAADDDPSGIATYSQAGAQFGLDMLWAMPLASPLMSAIQSMCAQIGRVTGEGLAANIKTAFPPIVLK